MTEQMAGSRDAQERRFAAAIGRSLDKRSRRLAELPKAERDAERSRLDDLVIQYGVIAKRLERAAKKRAGVHPADRLESRFDRVSTGTTPVLSSSRGAPSGRRVTGYASVFYDGTPETEFRGWPDAVERISPNAFDKSLARGDDVRGLFNHDPSWLLGRLSSGSLRLHVDRRGLAYEIDLGTNAMADAVGDMLSCGDLSGSSFKFYIADDYVSRQPDGLYIREIREVRLDDVGPVTYPAYEAASAGLRERSTRRFAVDTDVESLRLKRQVRELTT